jgi:hypothetical protein
VASTPIPDTLAMRVLMLASTPAEERERVAEALRAAGRRTEALLLYEGRADHPALRAARDHAVMNGLGFQLLAMQQLGADVTRDHLKAGAQAAERHGRYMEARLLHLALGDEEAVRRIAAHLPPSMVPPPPPPPEAAPAK